MFSWRKLFILGFIIIISGFSCDQALARKGYDYIDINNPFLRKIPIAIPIFKPMTQAPGELSTAKQMTSILEDSLLFTGYFKLLDRGAFLIDPINYGIVAPNIEFKNWTGIGAELLITGGLLVKEDLLEIELRLYDTVKQKLLVGKRYKGSNADQRQIIHRFSQEVIFLLTGDRGFFGSKIAFVSNGSGHKEIFTCDFDGHSPKQLTRLKSIALSPAWSSDGKWMAYTSYAKGKPDLYIKHLDDKRGAFIAKKGINVTPAWVPEKFALAATLSFEGDPEIYLLTGKGKIIKKITNNWGIDVSPTWSPDGSQIAFVSNRAGNPQIFIKNVNTGQTRRLTYQGRYNTTPSWSPKGDRIAYSAAENGQVNIYVIHTDGSNNMQLTQDSGRNESPSWSPDGSLIVFSSTREGPSRLYLMTAYGTEQRRLLSLPGEQTNPKWSPRLQN
jgi:TolB protein